MLEGYLTAQSGLPGERLNVDLAVALADEFASHVAESGSLLWGVLAGWASRNQQSDVSEGPYAFLPICAALCMAALGIESDKWWPSAFERLRGLASDPREQVREAVVLGLQWVLDSNFLRASEEVMSWVEGGNFLEMNAVAQTLAEPRLIAGGNNALIALALHRALVEAYLQVPMSERDDSSCRALRNTLATSLSVAVASAPAEGFAAMWRWAAQKDPDLNQILVRNLSQARLAEVFVPQANALLAQLRPQ